MEWVIKRLILSGHETPQPRENKTEIPKSSTMPSGDLVIGFGMFQSVHLTLDGGFLAASSSGERHEALRMGSYFAYLRSAGKQGM